MEPEFTPTFQMSSRDLNHAAIAKAAGFPVEAVRQAASRRCVFYFPDTPEIRSLLDRYERREVLPLPAKDLLSAKTHLYHEAARALREAL